VPEGDTTSSADEGRLRLTLPVRIDIGWDHIHGAAKFELEGDRVAAFEVVPVHLHP
jgi:hypothetical protein